MICKEPGSLICLKKHRYAILDPNKNISSSMCSNRESQITQYMHSSGTKNAIKKVLLFSKKYHVVFPYFQQRVTSNSSQRTYLRNW